jgi:hypothetical protein
MDLGATPSPGGRHPTTAAIFAGVLVLLVLAIGFALVRYRGAARSSFEGLAAARPCPEGYALRADGASQYCVPERYAPDLSACKAEWDPAAAAEAQALATVGAFQHDDYGERALQGAIDAAYDGGRRP